MKTEQIDGDGGDLMTLDDFVEDCNQGSFIDYDGFGYYSDGKVQYPGEVVCPSDITEGHVKTGFSHVVWFNR